MAQPLIDSRRGRERGVSVQGLVTTQQRRGRGGISSDGSNFEYGYRVSHRECRDDNGENELRSD
jgi:hypothetical protein